MAACQRGIVPYVRVCVLAGGGGNHVLLRTTVSGRDAAVTHAWESVSRPEMEHVRNPQSAHQD